MPKVSGALARGGVGSPARPHTLQSWKAAHTVAEWPQRQDPQLTPKAAGTRRFVAD